MDSATVLIIGVTGHGKSLLGNRLLNIDPWDESIRHFKTADTEEPETMESESISSEIENFNLTVIDTPGFFDFDAKVDSRWIHLLEAALESPIDAILIVVSSRRLDIAGECFNRIRECLPSLVMTRVIVVFTFFEKKTPETPETPETPGTPECENKVLTEFNEKVDKGNVGIRYIFSDQKDIRHVHDKMSEIITHVQDIKRKYRVPIENNAFVNYTKIYLSNFLQSLPQKRVTLQDLYNSHSTDMKVIEKFVNKGDIEDMIRTRNESREGCILS